MNDRKMAFISGHGDLTQKEFRAFYVKKIMEAIDLGHHFIVCDFRGADSFAQDFLRDNTNHKRVTVCHTFEKPRYIASDEFRTLGGFKSDEERDSYCTKNSDYDILWIREGKENSGTVKNKRRRDNE